MQEIILHVGLHKTGTTSIQETLHLDANNILLEQIGLIYPRSLESNHSYQLYSAFCDHPERFHYNIRHGRDIVEIHRANDRYLNDLMTEIAERDGTQIAFSAEELTSLGARNLTAFKRYLEYLVGGHATFRVVLYVRNALDWTISVIQEKIKGGLSYREAVDEMEQLVPGIYRSRIDKFLEVFGENFVYIYQFEQASANEFGIVGHFLSSIGVKHRRIRQMTLVRANESCSQIAGEIIAYINERLPLTSGGRTNVSRAFGDIAPLLSIRGPKFDIPLQDKVALQRHAHADMVWLKELVGIDYLQSVPNELSPDRTLTADIVGDIRVAQTQLPQVLADIVDDYIDMRAIDLLADL